MEWVGVTFNTFAICHSQMSKWKWENCDVMLFKCIHENREACRYMKEYNNLLGNTWQNTVEGTLLYIIYTLWDVVLYGVYKYSASALYISSMPKY